VAKRISVRQRPDGEQIELTMSQGIKAKLCERERNPIQLTVLSANLFFHKQISKPIFFEFSNSRSLFHRFGNLF